MSGEEEFKDGDRVRIRGEGNLYGTVREPSSVFVQLDGDQHYTQYGDVSKLERLGTSEELLAVGYELYLAVIAVRDASFIGSKGEGPGLDAALERYEKIKERPRDIR